MRNILVKLSLDSILVTVADAFPNYKPQIPFEEVARKALGKDPHIVSFKANRRESNVQIIIEKPDPMSSMMSPKDVYTLVRFFPLGPTGEWQVSFDVSDGHAINVFDFLLDVDYNEE
jgi:hypothetical protein